MWETLISKIQTTLDGVENVKDAFSVPKTKLTKYPAVFFKPTSFQNSFETQVENLAYYRFIMIVIVGTNDQMPPSTAFNTILPHTVDAIIAKFNKDWNAGTIDGHRVTVKIDSADEWQMSEEEDGLVAYAPLHVEFRLLTTN